MDDVGLEVLEDAGEEGSRIICSRCLLDGRGVLSVSDSIAASMEKARFLMAQNAFGRYPEAVVLLIL